MGVLQDKVVLITGASSGIGKACAEVFAAEGAKVVLAARTVEKLNELATRLGDRCLVVPTDVKNEPDCKNAVESAIGKFGKIDILVNNAGISMRALLADLDLKVIREVVETNFFGTVYCTRFAMPYLLKSKGVVVAVSSISGKSPLPGRTGYCASKYAMEGFMEALRIENRNTGVHVLVVRPGFTESNIRNTALNSEGKPQKESPRDESSLMKAEDVAQEIIKAIIKRKREITLTSLGNLLLTVYKFFPGFADSRIFKAMKEEVGSPVK